MAKFSYKVRDTQNKVITGTLEGSSLDEVLEKLAERGFTPISIDEANFDGSKSGETLTDSINKFLLRLQTNVPYKDVVFFTRQLATMVNSGVSLSQALEQLATAEKPVFAKMILQISTDISMGSNFSDAIGNHPGAFDNIYVSVVRSGEMAGALDKVLEELATYMENIQAIKEKVKGAMRYPAFIAGFVVILITGILWKLVPIFEKLYGSFGAKLPMATQILINASHIITNYFPIVIGSIIAIIVGFTLALRNKKIRLIYDEYFLYFPVFGMIMRKNIWARFSRTMALLLGSNTPILAAVEVTSAVVGNTMYAASLEKVYAKLRGGEMLSDALGSTGKFPVLIKQLVATGESAGRVDELLRKAADFYEREIRVTVDSLAAIIEPFLIITLGAIVGSILIALYMPVFKMGDLLK